ncbi:MAG: hypothetical protein ACK5RG_01225 [Cyclobacteriaceae bacterium]|jgi:hypothetical protein|nr:hypothetical protein [Bacteroidota bacterium]MCE2996898.1 hypothetical protein [Flammeovirgaceae bacterium]
MATREYQNHLVGLLQKKLLNVKNEWQAFPKAKNQYGPRVDIAIGPFNDEDSQENLTSKFNDLVASEPYNGFLKKAYDLHHSNLDKALYEFISPSSYLEVIHKNQNSRCLIAIEIESKNSRKHIMGSIVNAASLGRIGIGVGYDMAAVRTFLRIINYLSFLKDVGKNTYETGNFLVLTKEQMFELTTEE